jgi:hypothetical protein
MEIVGEARLFPLACFSLAALDNELLLDIFNTAKKVVKFKFRLFA